MYCTLLTGQSCLNWLCEEERSLLLCEEESSNEDGRCCSCTSTDGNTPLLNLRNIILSIHSCHYRYCLQIQQTTMVKAAEKKLVSVGTAVWTFAEKVKFCLAAPPILTSFIFSIPCFIDKYFTRITTPAF